MSGDDCGLLPGGKCWYDAGYLMADDVFGRLVAEGSDGLWASLREHYDEMIAATPDPRDGAE